jgi:hypothetical protein
LNNRHCVYYNKQNELPFKEKVYYANKLQYDPSFKSSTNVHMGQRKLLLSEIQLLTKYYLNNPDKHPVVLYIGAAPGTHLLTLSKLFPTVKFILYDGANFDPKLVKESDIFELHNSYFTDDICKDIIKNIKDPLLFISDIRLGANNRKDFENGVLRDMEMQKTWVQILKPELSLLKFRMSYEMKHGDKLKYMKGDILYGIWPKTQSAETRLLVTKRDVKTIINYDFEAYEQAMFFHNKYTRAFCTHDIPDKFKKFVKDDNIYCSCYDCMAELTILDNYSKLFKIDLNNIVKLFGTNINWDHKLHFQFNRPHVTLPLTKLEL